MAVEIEGLEFQIEAKSEAGSKGVDELTKSFRRLKTALRNTSGLDKATNSLDKLQSCLERITNRTAFEKINSSLSELGRVKISATISKQIDNINTSIANIQTSDIEKVERLATALQDIGSVGRINVPNFSNLSSAGQPTSTDNTNNNVDTENMVYDSGVEQAESYVAAANEASAATSTFRSILNGVGGVFSRTFTVGNFALKSLKTSINAVRVATNAAKYTVNGLGNAMGSMLGVQVKKVTSGLGQFLASIKRIAMYRLIRFMFSSLTKAMKEGMNNLYQYSKMFDGTFAKSLDSVSTSFLYLKNSAAAMVAPLINALAPAIEYITDKVVDLFNIVNQLFARLTGSSTYTIAKRVTTEYADAADDASSAATKLKNSILGFDEINALTAQNQTDYSSMFENVGIDSSTSSSVVNDFADQLIKAFEDGNWGEVGTIIGNKINDCIDKIGWDSIGSKIGNGIDNAVKLAYNLLDTTNFTNIGNRIATLMNNALSDIDFEFVGRLLVKPFTSVLDLIIGFITELDWGLVAKSVSDCLKGAMNETTDWFKGVDWTNLGEELYQDIKDVFTNFDFAGVSESFFTLLGTAIRSAAQFLGGFFGSIGEDIKNWWNDNIDTTDCVSMAASLLDAIGQGFINIGKWVYNHVIDPFVTALTDDEYWFEDMVEAGENIISGLFEGISQTFKNIKKWIKTHIVDPFVDNFKELFGINSPSTVMYEQGEYIGEGLLNGIASIFKNIKSWVKKNILEPIKKALEKIGLAVEVLVSLVKDGWDTLTEWVGEIGEKAVKLVKDGWTTVSNFVGNIGSKAFSLAKDGWDTVSNYVGDIGSKAFNLAKDGWDTVSNFVGDIGSKAFSLAKSGWTTVSGFVGDIGSKAFSLAKSGWSTISEFVGSIGSKAFSLAKSGWDTVSNFVGEIGSKAFSLAKDGWSTISEFVGDIGSKAFSLAKSGWSTISEFVGSIGSKAFSLAKSGWDTVSNFVGEIGSKAFSLAKDGWSTISEFVGEIGTKAISLAKDGWTTLSDFVGEIGSKAFSLAKSGWDTVSNFVGDIGSKAFSLAKSGWTTVSGFVGDIGSKAFSLAKSGWSTISEFVGSIGSKAFSLAKSGWSTISEFVGSIGSKAFSLAKSGWTTVSGFVGDIGSKAFSLAKSGWSTISEFVGSIGSKSFSLAKSGWSTISDFVGSIGSKSFSLAKNGWDSISNFVGDIGNKSFGLAKSGWSTLSDFVGNIGDKAVSLSKNGWTTLDNFVGSISSKAVSLTKSGWSSLSSWVGTIGDKSVGLSKSGWTSLKSWVGDIGNKAVTLSKQGWISLTNWVGNIDARPVSLSKNGWYSLANWVGEIGSKNVGLTKNGWFSLSNWVGEIGNKAVGLTKNGWSTISNYVGDSVTVDTGLKKNGWSTISKYVGNSVDVSVSLKKSGWSSLKSFFGLSGGGIVGANGSVTLFANGGVVSDSGSMWQNIPKYGSGTENAHGTMFVAGEAGPEIVGHVNGRTEVLNKSQIASAIYTATVQGMIQFTSYWDAISKTIAICSGAVIQAMPDTASIVIPSATSSTSDTGDWISDMASGTVTDAYNDDAATEISTGIREGMYEANARQNDLLREQNDLLKQLLDKDTTVEITTNSFTKALNRKNQRDGKTVVPVSI